MCGRGTEKKCKTCGDSFHVYCDSFSYEDDGYCSSACLKRERLTKLRKFSSKYAIPVQVLTDMITDVMHLEGLDY